MRIWGVRLDFQDHLEVFLEPTQILHYGTFWYGHPTWINIVWYIMCICINYTIHTISYHRPVLNVLGWKCKHYSSALPPERLKRGLFSISHTSFGIASTRRCGWSLDDNWKIITYESTFQATSPTQNIEIIHHMIFMEEIWRSHHLKIVFKTRRKIIGSTSKLNFFMSIKVLGGAGSSFNSSSATWSSLASPGCWRSHWGAPKRNMQSESMEHW